MDEPSSPEGNPITLRIKFKSASLDEFVARYGADVSAGGIFIRTKQPLAVGSLLQFDFSLADSSPLMAGLGTVVWVREPDASRAGSVPGMGVRFDQLAPESQQTHQQILALKVRRGGDRPTAAPAQTSAPAPAARPAARPSAPPPITARPAPVLPVVAQPSRKPLESSDEFDSAGKTEIADRPPSFYVEALDKARGPATGARPAEDAAPRVPLEDTRTDSQLPSPADSSWSEPIDISEDANATASSGAAARAAAADRSRPPSAGDELAPASLDLPLDNGAVPVPVVDRRPSASAAPAAGQNSWLDRAMKMSDGAGAPSGEGVGAAPIETSAEHTEETAAPSEAVAAAAPAPAPRGADRSAFEAAQAVEQDVPDLRVKKGQGKTLIVVGIVAAGLAFAGVYLMQTKPWQTSTATVSPPAPAASEPVPAPAEPKPVAPSQPAVQPTPPPAEAVVAKPAEKPPAPEPAAAPAKAKPEVVEAAKPAETAKPVEAAEGSKHPGSAAGSGKKTPSKAPSAAAAPGSAAQAEIVYLVKVRSLPPGAQVLIDGEPMGPTPFQRRILDIDKPHSVTIRKPGYLPYESSVSLSGTWAKDGNTQTMHVFAKLKKNKATESAAPEAQPAPAPEQPEKL